MFIFPSKEDERKMDFKAIKGYLVGYDGDESVYISESHKVVVSRDVFFKKIFKAVLK